jgi:hypothetical protein
MATKTSNRQYKCWICKNSLTWTYFEPKSLERFLQRRKDGLRKCCLSCRDSICLISVNNVANTHHKPPEIRDKMTILYECWKCLKYKHWLEFGNRYRIYNDFLLYRSVGFRECCTECEAEMCCQLIKKRKKRSK